MSHRMHIEGMKRHPKTRKKILSEPTLLLGTGSQIGIDGVEAGPAVKLCHKTISRGLNRFMKIFILKTCRQVIRTVHVY